LPSIDALSARDHWKALVSHKYGPPATPARTVPQGHRYGYRRITALLRREGWQVDHKRVERIWRREGLKVPQKQPKRGRLWLNDGSCVRLRPEYQDHVWSYDLAMARTSDCRPFHILTILDEYTRQCLSIVVNRRIGSEDVVDQLFTLFVLRNTPTHIRSDNGPESTARSIRQWLSHLGVTTLFIEPGSPWENSYVESFLGKKMRDELLHREVFSALLEAKVFVEQWRKEYNHTRPHSSLGYSPPVPETILPIPTLATVT
jgi:putative transposase